MGEKMVRRSAGTHIRGNRISGNLTNLSDNVVKVLSIVKFSKSSITREEIMEQAGLPANDVERHIKLLLSLGIIKSNTTFPIFPINGWRVYTEWARHDDIIKLLRTHNFWDEKSLETKEFMESMDYPYPTGFALEGFGRQPNNDRSYPEIKMINEDLSYRVETMNEMFKWKEMQPFRPQEFSQEAIVEKKKKFDWILGRLSSIYRIEKPKLIIGDMNAETWKENMSSGNSFYNSSEHSITLIGKFSVTTFLHEFGHSRGFDEVDTVLWSVNLFKRIYPVLFSRLDTDSSGHTLVVNTREFDLN